ncbi:MAG: CPBP family intramembrane metalloprotease [Candidatus Pedobacter colombiensis]|uniref:CPBP family intramembrane metalloprotease n=1 Tax=Candidatus Pedobacter colombiensis TaxID=3121371 RepID=A0AAJ6B6Y4_9SPHI|nr:CPBP family intramembrane glutamic endopeptidase [Pedobacter sp.]WEK19339.1 MAG: CPBP family intramembrane metalloprotease [Pedobacter sp.]
MSEIKIEIMNSIQKIRKENDPFIQILMLVFYAIVGLVVVSGIGLIIVYFKYGVGIFEDLSWLSDTDLYYLPAQRILLTAQQIGLFLVPAFLLAKTEGQKINGFYSFKRPKAELLFIVLLIMICALPVLEWVTELNQKMVLPEAFKGLEKWMKEAEDQGMEMTKALLKMDNIDAFIINIFMIALLPAVAEEFMFRGGVQRALGRMSNNPHIAIWFTAIIFSAIHMQFYGFLPRMFLGAAFGYLYFWSGSLWYAIIGHFINNGYAVCVAWYMQKNNIPLSETDKTMDIAWYGYIISAILTFLLFRYFKNKTE